MKNLFFLWLGIAVIAGSFYLVLEKPAPAKYQQARADHVIKIGSGSVKVEIADSEEERRNGLSGRQSLPEGYGMLFYFEQPGMYGFWMKDMKFPIDIVWLDENYQVIGVEKNISPETFPKTFYPPRPARYVLELNAGDVIQFGL